MQLPQVFSSSTGTDCESFTFAPFDRRLTPAVSHRRECTPIVATFGGVQRLVAGPYACKRRGPASAVQLPALHSLSVPVQPEEVRTLKATTLGNLYGPHTRALSSSLGHCPTCAEQWARDHAHLRQVRVQITLRPPSVTVTGRFTARQLHSTELVPPSLLPRGFECVDLASVVHWLHAQPFSAVYAYALRSEVIARLQELEDICPHLEHLLFMEREFVSSPRAARCVWCTQVLHILAVRYTAGNTSVDGLPSRPCDPVPLLPAGVTARVARELDMAAASDSLRVAASKVLPAAKRKPRTAPADADARAAEPARKGRARKGRGGKGRGKRARTETPQQAREHQPDNNRPNKKLKPAEGK